MITRNLDKIYVTPQGKFASLRDYEVKNAIEKNEDVILVHQNKTMSLTVSQLKERFQLHKLEFKSKYNKNQKYQLIDFRWIPDKEEENVGS